MKTIVVQHVKSEGAAKSVVKKSIDIFNSKERLLSLDMKTKVVQHVPRINFLKINFT